MKLALLSDIHANLQAFEACLAHARAAGATHFALLGDLVGYGGQPAEVVEIAMGLAQDGAIVLRGNHDDAALGARPGVAATAEALSASWTRGQLGHDARAFLGELPMSAVWEGAMLVHASAEKGDWPYVDHPGRAARCLEAAQAETNCRRVFCGHVHHQRLFYQGRTGGLLAFEPTPGAAVPVAAHRGWVATVGSVGQPRDGDPRAMYALFDAAQGRLRFERVPYDHGAAAAAIRASTLPSFFADRLAQGR